MILQKHQLVRSQVVGERLAFHFRGGAVLKGMRAEGVRDKSNMYSHTRAGVIV